MWEESNFKYILLKATRSCIINSNILKPRFRRTNSLHVLQQRCRYVGVISADFRPFSSCFSLFEATLNTIL